ncbi:hypothetical protein MTP99_012902 [Tenebrio molitor]|nr:hypothetical protein MTP99_012902 [Tenebrio molitor]
MYSSKNLRHLSRYGCSVPARVLRNAFAKTTVDVAEALHQGRLRSSTILDFPSWRSPAETTTATPAGPLKILNTLCNVDTKGRCKNIANYSRNHKT